MRKITLLLLAVILILPLAACGEATVEPVSTAGTALDLEAFSAEELLAYAEGLRKKLSSYQFETTVTIRGPQQEQQNVETSRIIRETFVRSGYNTYACSVTQNQPAVALSFENKKALYREASGLVFCAENVSADDFDAALDLLSPYAAFQDWTGFSGLKKEGKTVSFEANDSQGCIALIAGLSDAFAVRSVSGTRTFDDEGFFAKETLTVKGDYGEWKNAEVTVSSGVTARRTA